MIDSKQEPADERYSRQVRFAPIGAAGQERLSRSSVVIMGCGALGSNIAQNLGRAGVGRLRIVDRDYLELSNLARQVLFEEADVRQHLPKAVAAANRLRAINSAIQVEDIVSDITPDTVLPLIEGADIVADGTDNMETRFILNDACVKNGTPWVYGGAVASQGMGMTILPGKGPCLRCVLEELPGPTALKTCNEVGVLNTLVGMVAAIQSNEIIKYLVGGEGANTQLLRFDIWTLQFSRSRVERRADCAACGLRRFDYLHGKTLAARVRGRSQIQITPPRPLKLDLARLARSLQSEGTVEYNLYLIHVILPNATLAIFPDGRAIVQGIDDESTARSLVERLTGR